MALTTGQNALSTSAEAIFSANSGASFREVTNVDSSIDIYIGSTSGVLTTTGHRVKAGASFTMEGSAAKGAIYAIAASGTPTITTAEW